MSIAELINQLESEVTGGSKVPGTARRLVNLDEATQLIEAIRTGLPEEMSDAQSVMRQKESIIKQAELEARRIRAYADEEATTIRETAEEKATAVTSAAKQRATQMVEETGVFKSAERRAEEIIGAAEEKSRAIIDTGAEEAGNRISDADDKIAQEQSASDADVAGRRRGADDYAREVLFHLEQRVADVLGQVRKGIDVLDPDAIIAR
jgi:vacuolar-type H+-ATPase subunit H